jgi:hypothetical protein
MTAYPQSISVTTPVSEAIERVKLMLFRPFDPSKWFTIGFCAWLAGFGSRGFSFNYGGGGSQHKGGSGGGNAREVFDHAQRFVMNNLFWILPLVVALVLLSLAVGVVLLWLRSRGEFMFLHCVALNKAEVDVPWRKFVTEGNSLFVFRLVLGLAWMIPLVSFAIVTIVLVMRMVNRGAPDWYVIISLIGVGLMIMTLGVVFLIIGKLTIDFVVPIMFLRRCKCLNGWREFGHLFSTHVANFVVYLLFQVVLGLAIGMMVLAAVIATCCIAGCLMVIPYLGTVVLLPVLTFKRSYSLLYLAQYGREYDVFPPPIVTTIPGALPPAAAA